MDVLVPFSSERPKTRLAPVLAREERERFARAMLADVLEAALATGAEPTVLATRPLETATLDLETGGRIHTRVDDRPLSEAVNAALADRDGAPVAVVVADLALLTPAALEDLFGTDGDVVIAPGRGGGTNALVVRHPDFRVDYHGASYLDHRRAARTIGAAVETVDSYRLATDIDEPADLPEVLLHADGRARATLEDLGFDLAVREGRVGLER